MCCTEQRLLFKAETRSKDLAETWSSKMTGATTVCAVPSKELPPALSATACVSLVLSVSLSFACSFFRWICSLSLSLSLSLSFVLSLFLPVSLSLSDSRSLFLSQILSLSRSLSVSLSRACALIFPAFCCSLTLSLSLAQMSTHTND